MILLLVAWAVVWGMGVATGAPLRQRIIMISVVSAIWLGMQFVLPEAHPLKVSPKYVAQSFLGTALIVGFGLLYRQWFMRVRARVSRRAEEEQAIESTDATSPNRSDGFKDAELERYARHIVLREIGGPGQKALRDAKVLVVGAGGLGSPALQYLAAAGVGTIGVVDDDLVELTNLQRQVIHSEAMIGNPKVQSAAQAMQAQNAHINVRTHHQKLTAVNATECVAGYDLVLDGCDDFETRYLVNRTCAKAGVPLIGAALSQWEGQISVFDPANGAPCYACIFPQAPAPGLSATCAEAGVLGPLPGVIGAMMAVEAVKVICKAGDPLRGRLMIYDALYGDVRVISARSRSDCPVCGGLRPAAG